MLRSQRQQHRILGRGRLQLEIELPAETLAKRQPPRAIDAAAERSVEDELHTSRLVEEALENDRVLGRNRAQDPTTLLQIGGDLRGRRFGKAFQIGRLKPALTHVFAKVAERARELVASRRRLSEPEGDIRR